MPHIANRRRRSRPLFLLAAFVVVGVSACGGSDAEVDNEVAQLRDAANALLDTSAATMPARSGEEPPSGRDAKMVWVLRQIVTETPIYSREVGARHGIDPDKLPEAWGTSRYMADASQHPDVGKYWEAYVAYMNEIRRTYPAWGEARIQALGKQARLSGRYRDQMVSGMRQSMTRQDQFAAPSQAAAAALDFHRFLVRVDDRVHYDARSDMAMFDEDADLNEANRLQARVNAAAQAVQEAQRRARMLPDSLAKML